VQVGVAGAAQDDATPLRAHRLERLMDRPPRVLIVDDDRDNREVYAEFLRYRGYDVTEAESGAEALEKASDCNPDLVLLDLRLPDVAGVEVSRQLRDTRPRSLSIVALSACVFDGDVETALRNGCDAFIGKPCLPDVLETEIRRVLDARAVA
jgi:two-component system, cell cycle response regulator DivK